MAIGEMRRSVFTGEVKAKDMELHQQSVVDQFSKVAQVPFMNGVLISGLALTTGAANNVQHKLGKVPQGWFIFLQNANSVVWNGTPTATILPLNVSANVTVTLWVF